jgi:hypothetical protein
MHRHMCFCKPNFGMRWLALTTRKWEVPGLGFSPEARCVGDPAGSYLKQDPSVTSSTLIDNS